MLYAPQSAYYHAKASCYLCGKTDDLVDTEVQIEGEGVLAICRGCVTGDLLLALGIDLKALEANAQVSEDLAEQVEVEKAHVREVNKRMKALKAELTEAKAQAKELAEVV